MPAPVYFLLHVPKTAGQTIIWHLQRHAAEAFANPDEPEGRQRLAGDTSRVRAICGHHVSRRLEAAFPGREIRRAVLLREPLSLQLSLYNFRMMSYRAKGLGAYSFDLHLKALPRNFVADFLLQNWLGLGTLARCRMTDAEAFALLNAELAKFWFVGARSDCDRLIATLAEDLVMPAQAQRRNSEEEWREQVDWRPLRADEVTPAQRARIAADHPVDQALWETWGGAGFDTSSVQPRALPSMRRGELLRPALHDALRLALRELRAPGQASRVARADRARARADWAAAAEAYRRALRHAEDSPALWLQCARALRGCGRQGEAKDAYLRAIELKPDFPTAWAELEALG